MRHQRDDGAGDSEPRLLGHPPVLGVAQHRFDVCRAGGRFGFHIGLGVIPFHLEEPVLLEIDTKHVPAAWTQTPVALGIADTLRAVGAKSNLPLYLLPGLRQRLVTVPVKPKVKAKHGLEVKEREPGVWLLRPDERAETTRWRFRERCRQVRRQAMFCW
jgi:hypothetical protein